MASNSGQRHNRYTVLIMYYSVLPVGRNGGYILRNKRVVAVGNKRIQKRLNMHSLRDQQRIKQQ